MKSLIAIIILKTTLEMAGSSHSEKEPLIDDILWSLFAESPDTSRQFCGDNERCKVKSPQGQICESLSNTILLHHKN